MTKHFCDVCGKQLKRNYVSDRHTPTLKVEPESFDEKRVKVTAQVTVAVNDVWNEGDICLHCLLRVLKEGEEK